MTRVDEFDSFYRSTVTHALSVTYAQTGDREATREAVLTAYRHAWRDWSKIRHRQPLVYLRQEAHKAAFRETHTHPIRHRHQTPGDKELIDALSELQSDSRRLIILMTIGHADLESASREVGITVEEGIELATTGLDELENALSLDLTALERRIGALASIDLADDLPEPAQLRRRAIVGRQVNTVAMVAAAVVLVIAGGLFATSGSVFALLTEAPDRERLGAESPDALLKASRIDTDSLLAVAAVGALNPSAKWTSLGIDKDPRNETPYATCPTERFATDSPIKVMVGTHETAGKAKERVAQSIEVARSRSGAATAFDKQVLWFADCQHPRVQLIDSWEVEGQPIRILRMVSHRSPMRTFTIGFSRIGNVTNTVVHEVDGAKRPSIQRFLRTLDTSITRVCTATEAVTCPKVTGVRHAAPPRTSKGTGFLAVVDLPPVAKVDSIWAAVAASSKDTAAQTLCKEPQLTQTGSRSRLFVIPDAGLPQAFGVSETAQRFSSAGKAERYIRRVTQSLANCPKRNLSAHVSKAVRFGTKGEYRGYIWQLTFEAGKRKAVKFQTAVVIHGEVAAQLTFTPDSGYDLGKAAFRELAERAVQRLAYFP